MFWIPEGVTSEGDIYCLTKNMFGFHSSISRLTVDHAVLHTLDLVSKAPETEPAASGETTNYTLP